MLDKQFDTMMDEIRELARTATDAAAAIRSHEATCIERWKQAREEMASLRGDVQSIRGLFIKMGIAMISAQFAAIAWLIERMLG